MSNAPPTTKTSTPCPFFSVLRQVLRQHSLVLYQIGYFLVACFILFVLVWATRYQHGAFGPVIVQALLLVGVLWAVATRGVGQLFDIFTPNSAAEAGFNRNQFSRGKTHYTFNWAANLIVMLLCWTLVSGILLMLATNQRGSLGLRFLTGYSPARRKDILVSAGKIPLKSILQSNNTVYVNGVIAPGPPRNLIIAPQNVAPRMEGLYFGLLIACTWFIWYIPCGVSVFSLWCTQQDYFNKDDAPARPKNASKVDYHGMALVGVCTVLGTLSLSAAEFWLGLNEEVGVVWTLFALTPIALLTARLFSPWKWTEGGKEVLNERCSICRSANKAQTLQAQSGNVAQKADCKCNPTPVGTMAFLQNPAAEARSKAIRADLQADETRQSNHEGPVIIVCAGGGGSRASLFTASILSRMWWQNVPAAFFGADADGGAGAKENISKAAQKVSEATSPALSASELCKYPGRMLLQCADAISSVSGGSLASAYLVESLYRFKPAEQPKISVSNTSAACERASALKTFFEGDKSITENARPPVYWYSTEMQQPKSLEAFFHCSVSNLERIGDGKPIGGNSTEQKNFEANPFINAMAQDHLAACISGFFILPTRSYHDCDAANSRVKAFLRIFFIPFGRGPNIERFWEQQFSWYHNGRQNAAGTEEPVRLCDFYEKEQSGCLPSLVLNATLTGTGTRLAITNLDNATFQEARKFGPFADARDLGEGDALNNPSKDAPDNKSGEEDANLDIQNQEAANAAQRKAACRYDPLPAQINTLNALDSYWKIPLKSAVRASANFPFGFPLMRFRRYHVKSSTQGGTLDGTPVVKLDKKPDILDITDGGLVDNTGMDTAMALIRANRGEIRKRGVLIFLIDNGELPRNPGLSLLDTLLYNLSAVRNGMWRTSLNMQAALHSEYLAELRALFEPVTAPGTKEAELASLEAKECVIDGKGYVLGFEGKNVAFYVVRPGELDQEHVMTSWHLDAGQRALLYNEALKPQQGQAILRASRWFAERLVANNGLTAQLTTRQTKPE